MMRVFLKILTICLLSFTGCTQLDEEIINFEGEYWPVMHFEHMLTFPEYDRDFTPSLFDEIILS